MPYKTIVGLIPTIQATQLLGENIAVSKKEKITTKDMMGLGMKNIVGIEVIKLESGLIAGL